MLWPFIGALGIHLASGVMALLAGASNRRALAEATTGCLLASLLGGTGALRVLLEGGVATLDLGSLPLGGISLGIDPLSAFFLLCIYGVSGLSALYGPGYLAARRDGRPVAPLLFLFSLLVASMALLALARDGVLFLVAWEVMSLSGYFLVTFEHERDEVRKAGTIYLVASQLGVVFLFCLFASLAGPTGDFAFATFARNAAAADFPADLVFLFALLGFGSKAGFWILHVWLPEAHPAAPSHVSSTMSGVMIKMGVYGLLRTLTFLGTPPSRWGVLLVAIGAVSGLLGVLHALAQRDLKRLLAYSSVENVGIVTMGIGLGMLGRSASSPVIAALGYGGALLHSLNHGLFKGLLFHGAGAVIQAAGTKRIDAMGGLARSMPFTAACFLVASLAICGLPPLNGFVGEFLLFLGALRGGALQGPAGGAALAVVPVLALIGGLAAACFVQVFGAVFLGTPRAETPARPHEAAPSMRLAMGLGALACLALGLFPTAALRLVEPPLAVLAPAASLAGTVPPALIGLSRAALLALLFGAGLLALRAALLRGRSRRIAPTWGCGYHAGTPRMQYTASSFADPVLGPFEPLFGKRVHATPLTAYFPVEAAHVVHRDDRIDEGLVRPAVHHLLHLTRRLRVLQSGRVQLYLVYMLVTLILALLWHLGGRS